MARTKASLIAARVARTSNPRRIESDWSNLANEAIEYLTAVKQTTPLKWTGTIAVGKVDWTSLTEVQFVIDLPLDYPFRPPMVHLPQQAECKFDHPNVSHPQGVWCTKMDWSPACTLPKLIIMLITSLRSTS